MANHDPASGLHALESSSGAGTLQADFLSQVLTLIRLRAERVFASELLAPWEASCAAGSAYFHVLSEGGMRVVAGDGRAVEAHTGDLLVLPQGRGHAMAANGTATTRMITGAFRFEGDNLPEMLAVLPSIIHIPKALRGDDGWIDAGARFLLEEAAGGLPGASILISRMVDVLVIRMMRIWVGTAQPEDKGWLGALADPRISRALKAIHDEPFRQRTVAELAGIAGMSRSSFADRFASLIGAAPLHYQTRWRLLLAQEMLKRGDARVSDIGRRIGYDSDAAFSRAFKAQFGISPSSAKTAGGQ
jgi:AraC-like DNA-binding protein